jgi:N-acyl-D-amino-acid deacylase
VKEDPGDYRLVMISSVNSSKNKSKIGRNLQEIAEDWQVAPADAVLKLLVDAEGSVGFIGHGMSPANVELVLRHPLTMIGSDGSSISPFGSALESRPHPRYYGTFPRVLGHYVRERKALTLTEAVKKMTSMPADQIGLSDRGRLARGKKADIVIFDSGTIIDRATFQSPHQFPQGIKHVLVNGELVVEDGRHTGRKPGRALRRSS